MGRKARTIDPAGKRAAVLDAAMTLFTRKGYAATSIADIAAQADVAVGSVYRAFADKAALLAAIQDHMSDHLAGVIRATWSTDRPAVERIRHMCAAILAEARIQLGATATLPGTGLVIDGAQVVDALAGVMSSGIEQGILRPVPLPETARLAATLIDSAIRSAITSTDSAERERYLTAMEGMLIRAIVADPPQSAPKRMGLTLWR
ncbi:MAG: TetR/AcrR family transcriptional regulator [Labrys sp. (in: a-proteobacteria)]